MNFNIVECIAAADKEGFDLSIVSNTGSYTFNFIAADAGMLMGTRGASVVLRFSVTVKTDGVVTTQFGVVATASDGKEILRIGTTAGDLREARHQFEMQAKQWEFDPKFTSKLLALVRAAFNGQI